MEQREANSVDQEEHFTLSAPELLTCSSRQGKNGSSTSCLQKEVLPDFVCLLLSFPTAVLHSNSHSLHRLGKNPTAANIIIMYHVTLEIHVPYQSTLNVVKFSFKKNLLYFLPHARFAKVAMLPLIFLDNVLFLLFLRRA